jgi:3-hydroxyacyl-[acyl-carrier-protein] dehydratase
MTNGHSELGIRHFPEASAVPAKDQIVDFSEFSVDRVVATLEDIRRYNLQRFEMEQLTAIVFEDQPSGRCVGYKDVTDHEFWARGHMPGYPLMPGVVMCEAAAQLASYFAQKYDMLGAKVVGFGGMEGVRFRDQVRPGQRLVLAVKLLKLRRGAMLVCRFQGFVNQAVVVDGQIKGVPLPIGGDPPTV